MNSYLRRDFFQVEGYTSVFDARLFDFLLEMQSLAGITGSTAEIGVHHGRSFFLLARARRAGEQALRSMCSRTMRSIRTRWASAAACASSRIAGGSASPSPTTRFMLAFQPRSTPPK